MDDAAMNPREERHRDEYSPVDSYVCHPYREDFQQRYLEIYIDILRWIHMFATPIEKIVTRDT